MDRQSEAPRHNHSKNPDWQCEVLPKVSPRSGIARGESLPQVVAGVFIHIAVPDEKKLAGFPCP